MPGRFPHECGKRFIILVPDNAHAFLASVFVQFIENALMVAFRTDFFDRCLQIVKQFGIAQYIKDLRIDLQLFH